jgi:hypothetical protein
MAQRSSAPTGLSATARTRACEESVIRATTVLGTAALLTVGLAACGAGRDGPPAALCPRVAIINGLESLERPMPDGSGEIAYRAALENIDGRCRPEDGDLLVDIVIDVVVNPGQGFEERLVELPYFVAVSAPNGDVLDRQDFVAKINLAPGARSSGITETFSQRFAGLEEGAAGYQVLFGFALPPEEALRQRESL